MQVEGTIEYSYMMICSMIRNYWLSRFMISNKYVCYVPGYNYGWSVLSRIFWFWTNCMIIMELFHTTSVSWYYIMQMMKAMVSVIRWQFNESIYWWWIYTLLWGGAPWCSKYFWFNWIFYIKFVGLIFWMGNTFICSVWYNRDIQLLHNLLLFKPRILNVLWTGMVFRYFLHFTGMFFLGLPIEM